MAEFYATVFGARGAPGLQKIEIPFQADALVLWRMGTHRSVPGSGGVSQVPSSDGSLSYGFVADNGGVIEQGAVGHARATSQGTPDYCIHVPKAAGGQAALAAVDSIQPDGVRFNWEICERQFPILMWAISGVQAGVESLAFVDNTDEGIHPLEVGFPPDTIFAAAAFNDPATEEDSVSIGLANATQQAALSMGGKVDSDTSTNGAHLLSESNLAVGMNSGPSITNVIGRDALTSTGSSVDIGPLSQDGFLAVLHIRGLKSSIIGTTINGLGSIGNKDTLASTGWSTESLFLMHAVSALGGSGGEIARAGVGAAHQQGGVSCYGVHRVVSGEERWYSQFRIATVLAALDVGAGSVADAAQRLFGFSSSPSGAPQLETVDAGVFPNFTAIEAQFATGNLPPDPPLQTFPVDGEVFQSNIDNDLTWDPRDPNGDDQYAYQVQVREQGSTTNTIDVTTITSVSSHTILANTLTAERDFEWRVRNQDPAEEWGEFTAWEPFRTGLPPDPPTIDDPAADGATIAIANYQVKWSAIQQEAFQVGIGDSLANPTAHYNSGQVVQPSTRQHNTPFPDNSVSRTIFVRIRRNDLWSAWAARQVNVQYTPPDTPTLAITPDFPEAAITIGINNDPRTDWVRAMQELAPLAWWRLGEAAGATTAKDETGNGHDGTYQGGVTLGQPSLIATDGNMAASFDEVNDEMKAATVSSPATEWTRAFWWEGVVEGANLGLGESFGSVGRAERILSPQGAPTTLQFAIFSADASVLRSAPAVTVPSNSTSFIVTRWIKGDRIDVWLDGILAATHFLDVDEVPAGWQDPTYSLRVNKRDGVAPIGGLYDEVAVWNRALSAQEISDLYEAGATGYPGEPTVTSNELWRRETGDPSTEKLLDGSLSRQGSYVDWAIELDGEDYEYLAIANGDNGVPSSSGWLGGGEIAAGETWIVGGGSETTDFDGELSGG